MTVSRSGSGGLACAGLLSLSLAVAAVAAGEETAPPPAGALGSSPSRLSGKKPRSLAELARDIRLAHPEGGAVVVSDATLGQLAAGGRISAATGPSAPDAAPQPAGAAAAETPTPTPREDWEKRYLDQDAKVKKAEKWLEKVDTHRADARASDPYRQSLGPYSQAPGETSPSLSQRDDAARELAEAQENLERLKEQGRRLGVTPDQYPTPPPQPSPQPTPVPPR
jgi:hypothetical protein